MHIDHLTRTNKFKMSNLLHGKIMGSVRISYMKLWERKGKSAKET